MWFDSFKRPPPVSDHFISLHFGWLLTGGSTVFHFYYFRHRNYEKKDQGVCLLLRGFVFFGATDSLFALLFKFGHEPSSLYAHDRVFTSLKNRLYNTN